MLRERAYSGFYRLHDFATAHQAYHALQVRDDRLIRQLEAKVQELEGKLRETK